MVVPDQVCPYGLKAKDLLEREGFGVEDHPLETHEETAERIGGYEKLRAYFGKELKREDETSYRPVAAVFAVASFSTMFLHYDLLSRSLESPGCHLRLRP